jgi:hypothetical protein
MEERDIAIGAIGFFLGIGTFYGIKRLENYIEKRSEESGKRFAVCFFEELKKEGLLQYVPKQNPGTLDTDRIYKALDELTDRISSLESRLG